MFFTESTPANTTTTTIITPTSITTTTVTTAKRTSIFEMIVFLFKLYMTMFIMYSTSVVMDQLYVNIHYILENHPILFSCAMLLSYTGFFCYKGVTGVLCYSAFLSGFVLFCMASHTTATLITIVSMVVTVAIVKLTANVESVVSSVFYTVSCFFFCFMFSNLFFALSFLAPMMNKL